MIEAQTDVVAFESWCTLIERALVDDTELAWNDVLTAVVPALATLDPASVEQLSARTMQLVARIAARRTEILAELDAIGDERRQLVVRSRGLSSYQTAEALKPIENLLRMMWAG
jgi:hypothetical protein